MIYKNNKIKISSLIQIIICFIITSAQGINATYERYEKPYFSNSIYTNFNGENTGYLSESAKIFFATQKNTLEYYSAANQINAWVVPSTHPSTSDTPKITWIGHATFLIQIGGVNILTDPVFFDLSWLYPRNTPAGIDYKNLPQIDVVLISHSHRDHLDEKSLEILSSKNSPMMLLPKSTPHFDFFAQEKVKHFDWWESYTFEQKSSTVKTRGSVKFTFLPSRHWSNRSIFDVNKSLWGSWMIQYNDITIYFAGDSAYDEHFKKIAERFPCINIALMPIGPNEPRELMQNSHMSAEEAGQAFMDLKAHTFIPMHWGTFRLGTDSFDTPIKRLTTWWQTHTKELKDNELCLVKFGQTVG